MENNFETWIKTQHFSNETIRLFSEARQCYKIDAYSASLLFTYLAFNNIVRERVLHSKAPNGFTQQYWENDIKIKLISSEHWDSTTYECLVKQKPAPVFLLSDDVRQQIMYWKNRRNDCAHAKGNMIASSHTDSLCYFIQSNLAKFVVNGSKDSLIEKLKVHYDSSLTRPNTPVDDLVREISSAVDSNDLIAFFKDCAATLKDDDDLMVSLFETKYFDFYAVCDRCLSISPEYVKEKCIEYLFTLDSKVYRFLRLYPHHAYILRNNKKLTRKLWHDHLFASDRNDSKLFLSLLREKLIDSEDLNEFFNLIFDKANSIDTEAEEDKFLIQNGFYDFIFQKIENGLFNKFNETNKKIKFVIKYLTAIEISKETAKSIFDGFHYSNYAFSAAKALNKFFTNHPEKIKEYSIHVTELADAAILGYPEHIPSLKEITKDDN